MNFDETIEVIRVRESKRRARLLRNKTIRNPRFYLLFAVSIVLLPISLPIFLAKVLAEWLEKGANAVEDFFVRLLRPFNRWVDDGARKDGGA